MEQTDGQTYYKGKLHFCLFPLCTNLYTDITMPFELKYNFKEPRYVLNEISVVLRVHFKVARR